MARQAYHVSINGKPYIISTGPGGPAWEGWYDVGNFSPRVSQGPAEYHQYNPYNTYVIKSAHHGMNQLWQEDGREGHLQSLGLYLWESGSVSLFTDAAATTGTKPSENFVEYGGKMYASTGTAVYYTTGTEWVASKTDFPADVTHVATNGKYLFVAIGESNEPWRFDGSTWTELATGTECTYICAAGNRLWRTNGSNVYGTEEPDGTDWLSGSTGIATTEVGSTIRGLTDWQGYLAVGADAGLYLIRPDYAVRAWDCRAQAYSANFGFMINQHNGIYFPIAGQMHFWNGSRAENVMPPYGTVGLLDKYACSSKAAPDGQGIWALMRETDPLTVVTGYTLFYYSGTGWFAVRRYPMDVVGDIGWSPTLEKLYVGGSVGGDDYIPRLRSHPVPYPGYPTSGTHYVEYPIIHFGLREIPKHVESIKVYGQNLTADKNIVIKYKWDFAGSWTTLGTVTATDTELELSTNTTGKLFHLRAELNTNDEESSPILETITIQYMPRTAARQAGATFTIVVQYPRIMPDGTKDETTVAQQIADIDSAYESNTPVEMVDINGDTHSEVFITQAYPRLNRWSWEQGTRVVEYLFRCTVVREA